MTSILRTASINYSEIKKKVKRNFAIIGKRLQDKQGDILFTGATLSTAEEDILKDYLKEATQIFVGNFAGILKTNYIETDESVAISYKASRVDGESKVIAFNRNIESFVVAYIANAVLAMNYPDQAKKYEVDMQNHLQAALQLIYSKDAPEIPSKGMKDMTGEVFMENKPVAL